MENNRILRYEHGCSPAEIGHIPPPESMYIYEKRELIKKIIKRQIAEYEAGIFSLDPSTYKNNIFTKPNERSPSIPLPNNPIDALALVYESARHNEPPQVEGMDDRDIPIAEIIDNNIPIVDSVLYQPNRERVNTLVFNEDQINALRIEQDNWLYDNINCINKIETLCNEKGKCCISITIAGLTFGILGCHSSGLFGGKKRKSNGKTKKVRKKKKTKRKSNKYLKKVGSKVRSTCKK